MSKKIPLPTLSRLCLIYQLCEELEVENKSEVSSIELGNLLGLPPHSIRKDITYCGEVGVLGSGYTVVKLKTLLKKKLGFTKKRRVCVVGLGRLGGALLEYPKFNNGEFTVVAGFDTSVNRLETIHTGVKVYPVYEVADVVKRESIELAIIAVPAAAAQRTAHTLLEAGIRGIINFAPVAIQADTGGVVVRNIDIGNEFRIVSSLLFLNETKGVAHGKSV